VTAPVPSPEANRQEGRTVDAEARRWAVDLLQNFYENDLCEEALDERASYCWPAGEDQYFDAGAFTAEAPPHREALYCAALGYLSLLLHQRSLGINSDEKFGEVSP
jgi:hypothetical protein